MLLESLEKESIRESVVAPYVGQQVMSIGKELGGTVVFANGKLVKVKTASGKVNMYNLKDFQNKFSLGGEVANESFDGEEDFTKFFTLDFASDDLTNEQVVSTLREIADMIESGETEGSVNDEDDNEIGSFCLKCGDKEEVDEIDEIDEEEVEEV